MKNIRVIPCLDIKGLNLVKGVHLEGLRVLGKPEAFGDIIMKTGLMNYFIFRNIGWMSGIRKIIRRLGATSQTGIYNEEKQRYIFYSFMRSRDQRERLGLS